MLRCHAWSVFRSDHRQRAIVISPPFHRTRPSRVAAEQARAVLEPLLDTMAQSECGSERIACAAAAVRHRAGREGLSSLAKTSSRNDTRACRHPIMPGTKNRDQSPISTTRHRGGCLIPRSGLADRKPKYEDAPRPV